MLISHAWSMHSWRNVMARTRLDQEMVRRGLVESRTAAASSIDAGRVLVNGAIADKASRLVAAGDAIIVTVTAKYVGRGGEKLEAALDAFGIDPSGREALDIGSSTGGFTDCLLQRGARQVVAVDVGHNQLHERLRGDTRVRSFEGLHIREAEASVIGGPFDLVVCDLSFISLTSVSGAISRHCLPGADVVMLVKPQFEAGRSEVSKGQGIIKDEVIRQRTLREVADHYAEAGFTMVEAIDSPVPGSGGNVEFLLYLRAPGGKGSGQ